jgi:hypothetical protein
MFETKDVATEINSMLYVHFNLHSILFSEFLATDPEVPGSIPGASRFSKQRVWVHSAS